LAECRAESAAAAFNISMTSRADGGSAGKHEMISMIAPRDLLLCEALSDPSADRHFHDDEVEKKRNYEMKETESRVRFERRSCRMFCHDPKSHRSWVDTKNFSLTKYQRIHKRKKKGKLHREAINQAERALLRTIYDPAQNAWAKARVK
jgi:hypothetical protein